MNQTSPRRPVLLLALIAVVVVLLGWMVVKQLRPQPVAEAPVVTPVPGDAQGGLGPAGSSQASLSGPRAVQLSTQPVPDGQSLLGPPEDPAKLKAERDKLLADLERQHNAEPVDAAWAGKTEPALAELAAAPEIAITGIQPRDYQADCRSQTCRITANFDKGVDADDWSTFLMTGSGKVFRKAKVIVVPGPDGTAEVRIYGARR